jgi:hypothetical protein
LISSVKSIKADFETDNSHSCPFFILIEFVENGVHEEQLRTFAPDLTFD